VYLFSVQNNLQTCQDRVTDEEREGRMIVKDKIKEKGENKVEDENPESELVAKKEEDEEGTAQVPRIRTPHFGLANKEFKL
jgi:Cys-tRNA synthase (O-phospho-L-seryl-tRNA:Cys-tRNA synthase)